jgi:hypothetical protein
LNTCSSNLLVQGQIAPVTPQPGDFPAPPQERLEQHASV